MTKVAGVPHDKYSIGSAGGGRYGWAHTLTEAKKVGARIAKLEAYKGRWNILYITITISVGDGHYYRSTGWHMYVPVAGSGKRVPYIIMIIKSRHGVAPFKWTKR